MQANSIAEIIEIGLKEKDWKAADLARESGVPPATISRLVNGSKQVSADNVFKLLKALGAFKQQKVPMDLYKDGAKTAEIYSLTSDIDTAQYATIPLYDMSASAGPGMPMTQEAPDILKYLIFELPYLRKIGNFDATFGIYVRGDSMTPIIPDGSLALIDASQKDLYQGKKYYIRMGEMRLIKYIEPRPGKILLRSANKTYEDIEIKTDVDQPEDFEVLGTVIWHACED